MHLIDYMKQIILVRHAKSSWEFDVIDHERPLKKRGVNDANLISRILKGKNLDLDKVLSSDAVRAKSTADIFITILGIDPDIVELNHGLYDFAGRDLVNIVKNCDDSVTKLMVFGHNHAMTAFSNTYGDIYFDNVPTSGIVAIEFDIDNWKDLRPGKTLFKIFPSDLK